MYSSSPIFDNEWMARPNTETKRMLNNVKRYMVINIYLAISNHYLNIQMYRIRRNKRTVRSKSYKKNLKKNYEIFLKKNLS